MKNVALLFSVAAIAFAVPASAATLGFDDISGNVGNYNGYTFSSFNTHTASPADSGYTFGLVSPNNDVFNLFGGAASITRGTAFNLDSVYLTGAWNDGLTVQVVGTLLGNSVFTDTFVTSGFAPTLFTFNNASIDSAVFTSFGGTHVGTRSGNGTQFVMDDLTFGLRGGGAVPEPATWALMMVGFGLVGASMRRRQSVRVTYA